MSTVTLPRTSRNVSYAKIGGPDGLLAKQRPFSGNTMSARFSTITHDYVVYSYSTEIARVKQNGEKTVVANRWGVTTARHINLCKAWL